MNVSIIKRLFNVYRYEIYNGILMCPERISLGQLYRFTKVEIIGE